jgi:hypothetical protein
MDDELYSILADTEHLLHGQRPAVEPLSAADDLPSTLEPLSPGDDQPTPEFEAVLDVAVTPPQGGADVRASLERLIADVGALPARIVELLGSALERLEPGQYFEAINVSLASINEAIACLRHDLVDRRPAADDGSPGPQEDRR